MNYDRPLRFGTTFTVDCQKCGTRTHWTQHRVFQRCDICGDRFPCARICGHQDCAEYRTDFALTQLASNPTVDA